MGVEDDKFRAILIGSGRGECSAGAPKSIKLHDKLRDLQAAGLQVI